MSDGYGGHFDMMNRVTEDLNRVLHETYPDLPETVRLNWLDGDPADDFLAEPLRNVVSYARPSYFFLRTREQLRFDRARQSLLANREYRAYGACRRTPGGVTVHVRPGCRCKK